MPEWFWALRGAELLAVTIAGIAALLVSVGGAGLWLAKTVTGAMAHEQTTCPCWDCRRRRAAAAKRRVAQGGYDPRTTDHTPVSPRWKSTAELEPGMYVSVKGGSYYVKDIQTNIKGYLIELRNVQNRREMTVTVPFSRGSQRYWRPLGYWEKR